MNDQTHPGAWQGREGGRTLTLAQAEVFAEKDGQLKLVAFLTATLMAMEDRDGVKD